MKTAVFFAWIDDTSLPVQDSIKTDRQHFLTYRTLFIPAAVITMISFLLFIIDFIWLLSTPEEEIPIAVIQTLFSQN